MVNVLVIEDDSCTQEMFEQLLKAKLPNAEVYSALSLRQAEQWVKVIKFDVAIVDYVLPDGHGLFMQHKLEEMGVKTFFMSGFIANKPEFLPEPKRSFEKIEYNEMIEAISKEVAA